MPHKFITIGSKGVSIPTQLSNIRPPLAVGINRLRWANPGKVDAATEAHGWVSRNGEPFEIYPIDQAVADGRVRRIDGVEWQVQGRRYEGSAFLPGKWHEGSDMSQYVGVIGEGWPHGRIETKLVPGGRNRKFYGTLQLPTQPVMPIAKKPSPRSWIRDELLILLNVYDKIPFGQFDQDQPVIQALAQKMDRTPGSVAMKLSNLASLDPKLHARGRKGLPGASNLDRHVWAEFTGNRGDLAPKSEELFRQLFGAGPADIVELNKKVGVNVQPVLAPPEGLTESSAQRKVRRGQDYFRQVVLNAYEVRCCITGIEVPDLLVASHIKPWCVCNDEERLSARNGLCLSKLHDAAFDRCLITLDEQLRLVLSPRLLAYFRNSALEQAFAPYDGKPIRRPGKLLEPDPFYLAFHRKQFAARCD